MKKFREQLKLTTCATCKAKAAAAALHTARTMQPRPSIYSTHHSTHHSTAAHQHQGAARSQAGHCATTQVKPTGLQATRICSRLRCTLRHPPKQRSGNHVPPPPPPLLYPQGSVLQARPGASPADTYCSWLEARVLLVAVASAKVTSSEVSATIPAAQPSVEMFV